MKVVVVSHAMVQEASRTRWQLLAQNHDVEVTLLLPAYWQTTWFADAQAWQTSAVSENNFNVVPLPVTDSGNWNRYLFRSADADLRRLKPDIIYVVQEEFTRVLHQMILYRQLWASKSKLMFFSWNNLGINQATWKQRLLWWHTTTRTDAAIAGNSEIKQILHNAGYKKPIYIQTEIGVDERLFKPDMQLRETIRGELGLKGFVIGYAGRLTEAKGLRTLFRALDQLSGEWSLLIVGDGDLREVLADEANQRDYNACFTGLVDISHMQNYINAMDCLVLPSRTTPKWKEQFGLVLAQAMACRVPVIGSDAGAIPEVIGDSGLIFPEENAEILQQHLKRLQSDHNLRETLAQKGYERALSNYSGSALAKSTYSIFSEVIGGNTP
jgi:L-malate glycosyltransferase